MNFIKASRSADGAQLTGSVLLPLHLPESANAGSADITVGIRASSLRLEPRHDDIALHGQVELAEISGSDTFLHLTSVIGDLVAQVTGVHHFDIGASVALHFSPLSAFVFDSAGDLLLAPSQPRGR